MKGRLNYRRIKNEIYDKDNWFWYKLDGDYYFPEYYLGKRLSIEKATRLKEQKIIKRIVEYYNKEQKNSYGPDDRNEMEKMWPEINSVDEMLKHLEFSSIIIQDEYLYNDGTVFLAFFYDYGDDTEGDGIGVKIKDGEITEIGYISISF